VNERRATAIAMVVGISSALIRLVTLQWLHPLNWDEIEFYRAARWIAEGRTPFREFWEHHTPLVWYVFAPFTRLTDAPGVDAIVILRWAQVPVWIAIFWLTNLFMRDAGLTPFARWAAMAIALSSTWLMNPAVEFRLDPLAVLFYMGALVLWQRGTKRAMFGAGALFCLASLANMRLIPLLVLTVLFLRIIDVRQQRWKGNAVANWIFAGGIAVLTVFLLFMAATQSLGSFIHSVFFENYIGDKYATPVIGAFPHRLLILFGVRVIGSDRLFEIAAIDAGGIALFLLGAAGLFLALRRFRVPDDLFVVAFLELCALLVTAGMNFVYVYHFESIIILALPLIAMVIERIPRRGFVFAILAVAWTVNAFASFFRGKELDRAYQDLVMHELHARTLPGEKVWAGIPWALRREPSYHFWFLPDMTKHLVQGRFAQPYLLRDVLRDPPAAVVFDHSTMVWMTLVQRELAPYFIRHYIPVWRNLWVPGMNVRLRPGRTAFEWIVPRDGTYRLFASNALAKHMWFRDPIYVGGYEAHDVARSTFVLPAPAAHPELRWWVEGKPVTFGGAIALRKGQRVGVSYGGKDQLGVVLLGSNDSALFRQPPSGATLEASTSRVTHVPRFGVRIRP